jgi:hypothetical protein
MNSEQTLHKLLHLALIEIRYEAQDDGDVKNIAALSDLFHNVPLALSQSHVDHDKLLHDLTERASYNKGLSDWLNIVTAELMNNY